MMQREDVDRLAHYAAMLGIPLGDEHAALRDHHETVAATLRALLAERDAAFAAGQEAVVDWLDGFDTTGWDDREAIWAIGWVAELVRKSLPIKPRP